MCAPVVVWCMMRWQVGVVMLVDSYAWWDDRGLDWIGCMEIVGYQRRQVDEGTRELQVSVVNEATVAAIDCGLTGSGSDE